MRFKLALAAAVLLAGTLVATGTVRASTYTYTTIDDPNGINGTYVQGINNNGDAVGYYVDNNGVEHGFLYSGGSYTTLDDPDAGGSDTNLSGIDDNADIVGSFLNAMSEWNGLVYVGSQWSSFVDPDACPGCLTSALGVSDNGGYLVGYYEDSNGIQHGFSFSSSFSPPINDPNGAQGTYAYGVNVNGDIVGYYRDDLFGEHGFLYTSANSSFTTLDDPNAVATTGYTTHAHGINDNGDVVGDYRDSSGDHGFLYTPSNNSYTAIDDPNGVDASGNTTTRAFGINDSGQIVGYYTDSLGNTHGFLATPSSLWQNATSSGGGWEYLSPFGFFLPTSSAWIYHQTLGWLYPTGTSTDSIWFYDPQWDGTGGWWWTSSSLFPWIYSVTEGEWLYYDAKATGGRWFFTGSGQASTH